MSDPNPPAAADEPAISRERLNHLFNAADHQCPQTFLSPFVCTNGPEIRELVRGYLAWLDSRPLAQDKVERVDEPTHGALARIYANAAEADLSDAERARENGRRALYNAGVARGMLDLAPAPAVPQVEQAEGELQIPTDGELDELVRNRDRYEPATFRALLLKLCGVFEEQAPAVPSERDDLGAAVLHDKITALAHLLAEKAQACDQLSESVDAEHTLNESLIRDRDRLQARVDELDHNLANATRSHEAHREEAKRVDDAHWKAREDMQQAIESTTRELRDERAGAEEAVKILSSLRTRAGHLSRSYDLDELEKALDLLAPPQPPRGSTLDAPVEYPEEGDAQLEAERQCSHGDLCCQSEPCKGPQVPCSWCDGEDTNCSLCRGEGSVLAIEYIHGLAEKKPKPAHPPRIGDRVTGYAPAASRQFTGVVVEGRNTVFLRDGSAISGPVVEAVDGSKMTLERGTVRILEKSQCK